MKKISNILFVLVVLFFVSCLNKESNSTIQQAPNGYRYVDISKSGMNLFVAAPDSTVGVVDTVFDSSSKVYISVGQGFKLIIEESALSIAQKKEEIVNTTSDVDLLKQYIVDTDSSLLWQTTIGDLSKFHVYYLFKSDNRQFSFSSPNDEIFSQEQATKMLQASRLAIEKENEK